ncbi:chaperone protein DNAj, putative [Trypanosoma brucei gambiense DAL972]|uniref:Chaperone protein DNAj, putative n=2 Tax=Trypanosoma brucei TaxID=5691 RepID=C9ZVP3_TRYB9|nr:chaperone protein DNAj, putative [Trypanosoma brucei gambiense DAL972]RHW71079.1 chaperone protein DNAj [Trypanosoma brucei equiperdum]CBH13481.1 chaperone protein DNAj, putative [Trypanosoma brucei gambiense DAL972]|eukprot:XP_011775758.1 chaperone protein DNAj, putative [Trypanosoma brucei gambiense DAL972]
MFTYSTFLRSVSVGQACRLMGFAAPPIERRVLRRRYVELVKKHHPDNNGPESSAEVMANITAAYKTLQCLAGKQKEAMRGNNVDRSDTPSTGGGGREEMEVVAASFVVPGAPLSMANWDLPWQRGKTTTQKRKQEKDEQLLREGSTSLFEYVALARALEKRRGAQAERIAAALRSSEGSHGFGSGYFEQLHLQQRRDSPWVVKRKPLFILVCAYYRLRLVSAWWRWLAGLRYVVMGR